MIRHSALDPGARELVQAARAVRRRAHAPYSGFKVGAALRSRDGRIFTGCNVENASLGATVCAERGALMQAVAAGARRGQLQQLAIFTTDSQPARPCGMCLQVLVEFARDLPLLLANGRGVECVRLKELLPWPFEGFPPRRR